MSILVIIVKILSLFNFELLLIFSVLAYTMYVYHLKNDTVLTYVSLLYK